MEQTIILPRRDEPVPYVLVRLRWFAISAAIWLAVALLFTTVNPGLTQPKYFFLTQDVPIAALSIGFLMLIRLPGGATERGLFDQPCTLVAGMLLVAGIAWAGHYWLM